MIVYQTNSEGYFIGLEIAHPDPLDGGYLIPGGCVEVAPPILSENQRARWDGNDWVIFNVIATEQKITSSDPTKDDLRDYRRAAYTNEADPIFMMAQRGKATMEDWLAKIAEIEARYPYPEEDEQ
jgi:hypothetical protein